MSTMPKVKGQGTKDEPWQLTTPRNNRMRALGKKR